MTYIKNAYNKNNTIIKIKNLFILLKILLLKIYGIMFVE